MSDRIKTALLIALVGVTILLVSILAPSAESVPDQSGTCVEVGLADRGLPQCEGEPLVRSEVRAA